jgi:hypothetical protein
MSTIWQNEQRANDNRDRLLSVIDERRRTARYSEAEDNRPVCEHCNRHADFTEHWSRGQQRTMFSEQFQEQVWWTCDWCEAPTESDPYKTTDNKPMQSVGLSRALLDTGTLGNSA